MTSVPARRRASWVVYLIAGLGAILAYYTLPRAGLGQTVLLTLLNGTAAVAAFRAAGRTRPDPRGVGRPRRLDVVRDAGQRPVLAVHVNSLELQWRSPSGNPVVLRRGDMAVQYRTEAGACTGSS